MAIIWRLYHFIDIYSLAIIWRLYGDNSDFFFLDWNLYDYVDTGQPPMHHTIAGVSLCAAPMDGTESIINGGKTGNIKVGDSFTINCAIGRKK